MELELRRVAGVGGVFVTVFCDDWNTRLMIISVLDAHWEVYCQVTWRYLGPFAHFMCFCIHSIGHFIQVNVSVDEAFPQLMKTTAELLSLYAVIDSADEAVERVHAAAQAAADR